MEIRVGDWVKYKDLHDDFIGEVCRIVPVKKGSRRKMYYVSNNTWPVFKRHVIQVRHPHPKEAHGE